MILSDREIQAEMRRGAIAISPEPSGDRWSSTAVDLRLDAELDVWESLDAHGARTVIAPADGDFNAGAVIKKHTTREDCTNSYLFRPRAFLLAWTLEKIKLPNQSRLAARVEGKSSLARLGVGVHITAPTIHAGFGYKKTDPSYPGSPIRLEVWNAGR